MAVILRASTDRSRDRPMTRNCPLVCIPLQLYSMGTPNGIKVTILLEELVAAGFIGAEYDAWLIKISDGDQFG